MKREKGDNSGTFCVEVWITLSKDNKTSSCHILRKEDQLICQDLPFHGETLILQGLSQESVKREIYYDLLTRLTEDAHLIAKVAADPVFRVSLNDKIKESVIKQIVDSVKSQTIDSVIDEFIKRTKQGR
jgi:hypothetical protein